MVVLICYCYVVLLVLAIRTVSSFSLYECLNYKTRFTLLFVMIELVIYAHSLTYAQTAQKCFDRFSSVEDTLKFKLITGDKAVCEFGEDLEGKNMNIPTLTKKEKLDAGKERTNGELAIHEDLREEHISKHQENGDSSCDRSNNRGNDHVIENSKIGRSEKTKTNMKKGRKRSKKSVLLNKKADQGAEDRVVKTHIVRHRPKSIVYILIVKQDEDPDEYYDFLLREDENVDLELERVIMTIYNYKEVILKDLKVVDENNNKIKRNVTFYVKNVPYLEVGNVMGLDKKGTVKREFVYRKNSVACLCESDILIYLLNEYDLSFQDEKGRKYVFYRFYSTLFLGGELVNNQIISALFRRNLFAGVFNFFKGKKNAYNKSFRNIFLCEHELTELNELFKEEMEKLKNKESFCVYLRELFDALPYFEDHRDSYHNVIKKLLLKSRRKDDTVAFAREENQ